jgi:hypothetical protein
MEKIGDFFMKRFLIIFFLVLYASCSKTKYKPTNVLEHISEKTFIPIDSRTEPYTRTMQYLDGDLYWWNSDRESISVFDLSNSTLKKTILLKREGPNGVGSSLGFIVHNIDSIFIPNKSWEIKLINGNGRLINSYSYFNYSLYGTIVASMSRYSNMGLKIRDRIIFGLNPHNFPLEKLLNDTTLEDIPIYIDLNIKIGEVKDSPFRFDKKILEAEDVLGVVSTTNNENLLLLHQKSNLLYEFNYQNNSVKSLELNSLSINTFSNEYLNSNRSGSSIQENIRKKYKTAQNLGIMHDKYRGVIYRFGWPGEEVPININAMQFSNSPPYFVISIYDDQDYSLLQEFTLPRNTYLAHHYFVDENGLNLFPMHPDNPEFNEDEMVIHTFDFSSLKK